MGVGKDSRCDCEEFAACTNSAKCGNRSLTCLPLYLHTADIPDNAMPPPGTSFLYPTGVPTVPPERLGKSPFSLRKIAQNMKVDPDARVQKADKEIQFLIAMATVSILFGGTSVK